MKLVPIALAACLAAGCASGPTVETDRDPVADFSHYQDYAWRQEPPISNPMLKQRIVSAVDAELAARGWRRVAEAEADALLVGNVAARDEVALNYFYEGNGWSGWDWRGPANGAQRVEMRSFKVGTLVIDVFDAGTRQAVWRGVAQGTVPESEARQTRDAMHAVREMFRDFPQGAQ